MSFKAILSAVGQGIKSAKEKYEEERIKEILEHGGPGVFIDRKPRTPTLNVKLSDALGDTTESCLVASNGEDTEVSVEDLSALGQFEVCNEF